MISKLLLQNHLNPSPRNIGRGKRGSLSSAAACQTGPNPSVSKAYATDNVPVRWKPACSILISG